MKYRNGVKLFDENEIMKRWEEYVSELYDDTNRDIKSIAFDGELTGLPIMKSEVETALRAMKAGKATGKDGIATELRNNYKTQLLRGRRAN